MGLKKKLMMQAAAAEAGAGADVSLSSTSGASADVNEDPVWKLQNELLAVDDLTAEMDLTFHKSEPKATDPNAPKSKYKWETSLDNQFEFDFKTASPKEDISQLNWKTDIKGIMRSDAGAEGVFFADTVDGAVVLKGSRSMGAEIFSCLLGTKLGIFCPRFRLIPTKSLEGEKMLAGLAEKDTSGRLRLNLGSMQHVLLKAYLPGTNFGSLSIARSMEIFGLEGQLSRNGSKRLREIGRVLALDVLCNNGDRFPLIWDNRGNPGNIMMAKGAGKVVSIDSQIQPIDKSEHAEQYQAYVDKVKKLIKGLKENGTTKELPEFYTIRGKIKEFASYEVGEAGSIEMQNGFLEVVNHKASFKLTADVLSDWRTALASYKPEMVGLNCADVDFVMGIWDLF